MLLPSQNEIKEPLLALIYLQGGKRHSIRSRDVYSPLAKYFGLSDEAQQKPRKDGRSEPEWHNRVQYARLKLVEEDEYVLDAKSGPHGTWVLTERGVLAASSIAHNYKQDFSQSTTMAAVNDTASIDKPSRVLFDPSLLKLSPIPGSIDLGNPPGRVVSSVNRIIRDTALARVAKHLHNYECQICGQTIELPGGTRYAESHHLKPLGAPHNGPDIIGNILCVCPNHHAALDYGAIAIDPDALRFVPTHPIAQRFIAYHNQKVFRLVEA